MPWPGRCLSHAEDASDHNLPALIWTGLIPVAEADPEVARLAGGRCRHAGRRRADRPEAGGGHRRPAGAAQCVARRAPPTGPARSGRGRRRAWSPPWPAGARRRKPAAWDAFRGKLAATADADASRAGPRAGRALRRRSRPRRGPAAGAGRDGGVSTSGRRRSRTLIESRPRRPAVDLRAAGPRPIPQRRGRARAGPVRRPGDRAIAGPELPRVPSLRASRGDRGPGLAPGFARALLDQVAAGKIARNDLTAFHARQILSLGDPALAERLSEVWGEIAFTAADRRDRIVELKSELDAATLAWADRGRGRAVFDRALCQLPPALRPRRRDRARPDRLGPR